MNSTQPAPDVSRRLILDERVSIAIAAHGNEKASRKCIECLFRSLDGTYELVLIDDCSPDNGATYELFREAKTQHPNTKVFSSSENLEYTGSVNLALSHAAGDLVFFISNDIYTTPFYFANLVQAALSSPTAILRGSSNFVDNAQATHNITPSRNIVTFDDLVDEAAMISRLFGTATKKDKYLVGDAFLVTRPVLEKIGTFDPFFYGYFGDQDFGLRAQIAGFPLLLVQGAYAFHDRDSNFAYLPAEQLQEKMERRWMRIYENWARFKIKYGMPVSQTFMDSNDLPWATLASTPFSPQLHYSAPSDYSKHIKHENE